MENERRAAAAENLSVPAANTKHLSPSGIRLRAFILGLLIIPADNYWVIMMEKVRTGPYPTTISIFANAVFILAVLALLNTGLKRINCRWGFTTAEMLLMYTMAAIAAALAGHDMLPTLVGMMTYPWQFATPENKWAQTFIPHLPRTLSVTDPVAVKKLWEGGSSLYSTGYWKFWVWPVANWLGFTTVLVFVMMCINTLVRKQWTDRERLTFPIVQLPVAMTEPKGEVWKSRLFWIGFSLAATIILAIAVARMKYRRKQARARRGDMPIRHMKNIRKASPARAPKTHIL